MIKAILFDLDGTLIDTDELVMESYRHLFRLYRPDYLPSKTELLSFLGPPLKEIFPLYFKEDFNLLLKEYRTFNIAKHPAYVVAYEGVIETLQWLKSNGYLVAVITSKLRESALIGLNLVGATSLIDYMVGLDDVIHHKPHPEGILKTLEHFQVQAAEAIMIGDSGSDLQAGLNAGTQIGAVGWTIKGRDYIIPFAPTLVLNKMNDLIIYLSERERVNHG